MAAREQTAAECNTDYQLDRESSRGQPGWHYSLWSGKTKIECNELKSEMPMILFLFSRQHPINKAKI